MDIGRGERNGGDKQSQVSGLGRRVWVYCREEGGFAWSQAALEVCFACPDPPVQRCSSLLHSQNLLHGSQLHAPRASQSMHIPMTQLRVPLTPSVEIKSARLGTAHSLLSPPLSLLDDASFNLLQHLRFLIIDLILIIGYFVFFIFSNMLIYFFWWRSKFLNDWSLILLCILTTPSMVLRIRLVAQWIHCILEC